MSEDVFELLSLGFLNIKYSSVLVSQGAHALDLLGDVLGDIPSQDVPDEANTIEGVAKVHLESYATFLAIEEGPLSKLLLMAA